MIKNLHILAAITLLPIAPTFAEGEGNLLPQDDVELQLNMANELYAREMYKTAISAYEKYFKSQASVIHKRRHEALFRYGECLIQMKKFNDAVAKFDEVVRLHTESRYYNNSLFRRGTLRFQLNDPDKTLPDLELILKRLKAEAQKPENDGKEFKLLLPTKYYLGRAYRAKDRFNEARPLLSAAATEKASDHRKEALFFLADLDCAQENWKFAVANYESYRKQYPQSQSPLVNLRLGIGYRALEQFDSAITALQRIPAGHEFADLGLFLETVSFYQKKAYAEVLKSFEKLLKLHPENDAYRKSEDFSATLYMAGVSHFNLEQFKRAAERFQHLTSKFPKHPDLERAHYLTCMSFHNLQDLKGMEQSAKVFIDKFPGSQQVSDVHYIYADALIKTNRFAEAIPYFQKVPPKNEFHQEALYRIAFCQLQLLDKATAPDKKAKLKRKSAEALDVFVGQYPKSPYAYRSVLQSAELYMQLKEFSLSEKRFTDFLASPNYQKQAAPQETEYALYSKGNCQLAQENFEPMAVTFAELLQKFPMTKHATDAKYWIGRHYENRKEWEQSTHFYNQVAKNSKYVHTDDAIRRLGHCFYKAKQHDAAANTYFEIFKNRPKVQLADDIVVWVADQFAGRKEPQLKDSIWVYQYLYENRSDSKWRHRCLFMLHLHYFTLKDYKQAAQWGEQFLKELESQTIEPNSMELILFQTAFSFHQTKSHDKAEILYLRLKDQGQTSAAKAKFWLGRLYYETEKFKKAKELLNIVGLLTDKYELEGLYYAGLCDLQLAEKASVENAIESLENVEKLWRGSGQRKGLIDKYKDNPLVEEMKKQLEEIDKRLTNLRRQKGEQ